jgi:hypothetical protein
MDVDIETLVKYPMESDDWLITIAIGGIASLLSFLIVPAFVVSGYLVRALRAGMEGAEEPPVFDDWGELIKEGLFAAIITLVYQIIPLIVFAVFVGGSLVALVSGSEAGAGAGVLGLIGGIAIWGLLSLAFAFVGYAGVINYAKEGSLAAGFDFGVITDVITSGDYIMAWLYVIVLNFVVGTISGLLSIIPFLGTIIGVFLGFYALIIAGWLFGDGFASAIETQSSAGIDEGAPAV